MFSTHEVVTTAMLAFVICNVSGGRVMGSRKPRNKGMRRSYLKHYSGANVSVGQKAVLRMYRPAAEGLKIEEFKDTPASLVRGSLRHSWVETPHDIILFRHPRRTVILRFMCKEYKFLFQDGLLLKERRSGTFTSKLVAMNCYHNDCIDWSTEWFPLSEVVMQDT